MENPEPLYSPIMGCSEVGCFFSMGCSGPYSAKDPGIPGLSPESPTPFLTKSRELEGYLPAPPLGKLLMGPPA